MLGDDTLVRDQVQVKGTIFSDTKQLGAMRPRCVTFSRYGDKLCHFNSICIINPRCAEGVFFAHIAKNLDPGRFFLSDHHVM